VVVAVVVVAVVVVAAVDVVDLYLSAHGLAAHHRRARRDLHHQLVQVKRFCKWSAHNARGGAKYSGTNYIDCCHDDDGYDDYGNDHRSQYVRLHVDLHHLTDLSLKLQFEEPDGVVEVK
jgi:hypothetical protein